jgi:hypothetical protein
VNPHRCTGPDCSVFVRYLFNRSPEGYEATPGIHQTDTSFLGSAGSDSMTIVPAEIEEETKMKYLVLALTLVTFTACSIGSDPTVKCPDDKNKQLTRDEWRACNGVQDKESDRGM